MNGIQRINSTSFGAAKPDALKKAAKMVSDEAAKNINNGLPKGLRKVCNFLSNNDGEVQNQIINAVFTTTLAPLMIWKNPFSKKSDKDKAYSAIRQPISAGIAVSGGLGATLVVNKALDKLANEGYLKSLDLRMNPNDSYLKSQFNSELKQAKKSGKVVEFLKQYAADGTEITDKPSKATLRACLDKYSETIRKSRGELFETLMKEDPAALNVVDGTITLNGKKIAENIPNMTNKQLTEFLNKYNVKNIKSLAGKTQEEVNAFVKNTIKNIGKDFSNYKKFILPFINIPITVLTCTALNWVYPRFVETFFPSLLKSDNTPAQKGGNN